MQTIVLGICYGMSWDSSVSTMAGYGLDDQGLIPGRGRKLSLCHSVQTGCGVHPASYPLDMGVSFHRVKWIDHEGDHSPSPNTVVKNARSFTCTLLFVFIAWYLSNETNSLLE
jgi:hypothetical protein